MAFVGRLSNIFTSVHNFYNELNPATLSGAIDIVVVEQEDGDLACSPFHVRFGKLSLLMPQEKKVTLTINDQEIPFAMKLSEAGEAFFVFETDHEVPEEFQTSPLIEAADATKSSNEEPPYLDIGSSKDDHQRVPISDQEDEFDENDQTQNSNNSSSIDKVPLPAELQSPKMIIEEQLDKVVTKADPYHKMESLENGTEKLSLNDDSMTPKHDAYHLSDGSVLLERVMPDEAVTSTTIAKETFIVRPANGNTKSKWMDVTHNPKHQTVDLPHDHLHAQKHVDPSSAHNDHESIVLDISGYKTESEEHPKRNIAPKDTGLHHGPEATRPKTSLAGENGQVLGEVFTAAGNESTSEKTIAKETTLNTKLQLEPGVVYRIEMSLCGLSAFGSQEEENTRIFNEHQITYDTFVHNPNILNDSHLVFRYEGRYFGATRKGPLFTSLFLFHEPLSETTKHKLEGQGKDSDEDSDSRESYLFGRGWRQWWSRSSVRDVGDLEGHESNDENNETTTHFTTMTTTTSVGWSAEQDTSGDQNKSAFDPSQKNYAKTLRLTSEQLKSLGLKKGANTITYSVTSAYQGTASCTAQIFFWDYNIQIVISDIDGTITKSDALGHVFTMIGKDWTHNGVAKLYTDIRNNGYYIIYLTSRAIGQADYTRNYLKQVEQDKYALPDGPVIMSPDRLFTSFHREVIMRKPEVFKMACLRDVLHLFGDYNPFYAGFGNRITDAISYRSVGVPASRIFTIDPNGNVKLELLLGFLSSYIHLNDLVDQIFPPINNSISAEYSDWNFWKQPLPKIDIPELAEDTKPPPTSPKPVPIKPDPSNSLPASSVVESDAQKRRTRGILRSFTSLSSTGDSANNKLKGVGYHYSNTSSLLVLKSSSGRTSPDAESVRLLDMPPSSSAEPLSPEFNPTTPPSENTSPVPSTSSSSSIVNRVIAGGLGGMRTTLSRTFTTRKSSLAEELGGAGEDTTSVQPPTTEEEQQAREEDIADGGAEGGGDTKKEPSFDMDDDVDLDMDSIPFI